jgi:GTP-binding protein EngB required for normal cell division
VPFIVVLTKSDKVKQQELARHEKMLKQNVYTAKGIFKTSSEAGRGIRELRAFLMSFLAGKEAPNEAASSSISASEDASEEQLP